MAGASQRPAVVGWGMTPTPGPAPVIQAAPPQWWEILSAFSPLAVLLSAAIAGFFAWRSLRQSAATHAVDAQAAADRYAADAKAAADRHALDALAAIERQAAESLAAA